MADCLPLRLHEQRFSSVVLLAIVGAVCADDSDVLWSWGEVSHVRCCAFFHFFGQPYGDATAQQVSFDVSFLLEAFLYRLKRGTWVLSRALGQVQCIGALADFRMVRSAIAPTGADFAHEERALSHTRGAIPRLHGATWCILK